jgi:riboflavin biosynthesis pyrimidine reductase
LEFVTRFEELVARKTREAATADLPPFETETDSAGDRFAAIGNAWSRRLFDGPFYVSPPPASGVPSASLVFVRSRDGNTVAKNPSVLGGGEADKHLIYEGLSRLTADAVLSGASTIRGSDLVFSIWRPELVGLRAALGLPRHPIQIVATLHGLSLDEGLMFNLPQLRVMLVTVGRGMDAMRTQLAARPWVTPIVMEAAHDLPHAFRRVRQLGVERISCIGGRTIAGQLVDAGLIQDVYLTTGTKSAGEPDTPFYEKPLKGSAIVRKRGTGADAGVVFEHLALNEFRKFQIPNS